ncbi:MAG: chorismate synthase [Candidatus Cloacimonetes bacterium]|nr:chorismate synthase [Candidatus Cloacimonadota bacterium]
MPTNRLSQFFGISSFGESHGAAIGILIDSPPPNLIFPYAALKEALAARNVNTPYKTARKESDDYEILSGVFEGKTTGLPLCIIVRNNDARPGDYEAIKDVFRPGHADFSWYQKYHIYDYRGGGRASGRETLARVMASALLQELISSIEIEIISRQIGELTCTATDAPTHNPFHWQGDTAKLYRYLDEIKAAGDSVGGLLELRARKVPAGLGDPVYEKLSANIAKAMLSIPSVKGISFGSGMAFARLKGSEANDQISETGFLNNHAGGINGGISNGNDIVFQLIVRAVPSVSLPQKTIDKEGNPQSIEIKGRHDTCHIPRIIPVVKAMLQITLADALAHQKLIHGEEQSLEDYRSSLDKLDEELMLLLYRRRQIVQAVKKYKQKHNLPPKDALRETEIMKRIRVIAKELELDPALAEAIMQELLKLSQ